MYVDPKIEAFSAFSSWKNNICIQVSDQFLVTKEMLAACYRVCSKYSWTD
jgi:hypothetical protein